jgi:hypothetical protein
VGALRSTAPTAEAIEEPPFARAAEATPAPRRLYRPQVMLGVGDALDDAVETLAGTAGARWGLTAVRADDPARVAALDSLWLASANQGRALLERFGVALAILPAGASPDPGELVRRGNWALVTVRTAPPAAVYTAWEWAPDDRSALVRLFPPIGRAPRGLPRLVLRGEGLPNQEVAAAPAPCAIERWSGNAIDLTCRAPADGYAVVSSTAASGWSVAIDDRDAPWLVADVARRAVAIPAGEHRVQWRYAAPGLTAGLVLAALGVLALAALGLRVKAGASS